MAFQRAERRRRRCARRGRHVKRSLAYRSASLVATLGLVAITLAPGVRAGAAAPTIYVALGDSYSSGAGLGPFLAGPAGCDRSPQSYPELVGAARRLRLDFVACAGATVREIAAQVGATRAALERASLVTLTAGGNDLSFSNLLVSCLGGVATTTATTVQYFSNTSGPTPCASAVAQAASLLGASVEATSGVVLARRAMLLASDTLASPLQHRLTGLLRSVLAASGAGNAGAGARVLVVNYPMLLSDASTATCLVGSSPVSLSTAPGFYPALPGATARQLMAINHLLRIETSIVVARFHRPSSRLSVVWTPSFAPLSCATGTSVDLNGLSVASLESGGSFHPTAAGQVVLANAVRADVAPAR